MRSPQYSVHPNLNVFDKFKRVPAAAWTVTSHSVSPCLAHLMEILNQVIIPLQVFVFTEVFVWSMCQNMLLRVKFLVGRSPCHQPRLLDRSRMDKAIPQLYTVCPSKTFARLLVPWKKKNKWSHWSHYCSANIKLYKITIAYYLCYCCFVM